MATKPRYRLKPQNEEKTNTRKDEIDEVEKGEKNWGR